MSSLGGSTVSSSYNRLLVLPAGGGDLNNLVPLTDGDNATTFALKLSANAISIDTGEKFYLDGGNNSYITEQGDVEKWVGGPDVKKVYEGLAKTIEHLESLKK